MVAVLLPNRIYLVVSSTIDIGTSVRRIDGDSGALFFVDHPLNSLLPLL